MTKNNLILIIITFFISLNISAQGHGIRLINLETIEHGTYNRVELKDAGELVGHLLFEKIEDGKTQVSIDLSNTERKGVKLDYKRGQEVYYSDMINKGPSVNDNTDREHLLVKSETIIKEDQDWVIIGILTVAYCCVEIEVGQETTINDDGGTSTTTSWSLGFNCDCFSLGLSLIGHDGTEYENIDLVEISII